MKKLAKSGDESGIRPDWVERIKRILYALHAATHYADLDLPGNYWHELQGSRKGTYSVRVSGNWRVTYKWDNDGAYHVKLEDYHGR